MHYIQSALGHGSVAVTERYYAKYDPRSAARQLLKVIEGGKEKGNGYQNGCLRGIMAKDCVAEWLQVFDFKSAPGKTRTCGLLIRSQTLYPTELRAHTFRINTIQGSGDSRNPAFESLAL
jgi:hypothetical protein